MSPTTYEQWSPILQNPWGLSGQLAAALVALLALGLGLWAHRGERRRGRLVLLVTMRTLAVASLLLLVLQPAVQQQSITRLPNHVALLVDHSRSMALREQADQASRLERAAAVLKRSEQRLAAWRRQRTVSAFAFGATLRSMELSGHRWKAEDPATRTLDALTQLTRRYQGKDLAAVVLLSDGIDNGRLGRGTLSAEGKRALAELKVPVHTLWVGRQGIRDVAVAELRADHFAFVRNAVRVEVELLVRGIELDRLPVTLEQDGAVVARQWVRPKKGQARYRVELEFVPQQVGTYLYQVRVPLQQGEAIKSNNSRSLVLKVVRDRVRVLQLCGRPSWDQRFLRRLLKRDPNIDLISFFILRTPTDLTLVSQDELSLIPFPTEELFAKELGSFDLVLLQDFNYSPYGIGRYLPELARYVLQGGGLAMIGGELSFTSGGYAGSPLARVLPVELLPPSADPERLLSRREFRPRATAVGREHPILQLAESGQRSAELLAELPPLEGVNLVAGLMPGAASLLEHPALRDRRGRPMPVLATREVGKGRTVALTSDSSWHWAFVAVGEGGTREGYDRFWRNIMRWLIRDPELKYLRVIAQQDRVRLGAPVQAVVRAYNTDYSPPEGLEVSYTWAKVGAETVAAGSGKTNAQGELALEFTPESRGAYRIEARATLAGRPAREHALVLVDPAGPEETDVAATGAMLRQIAEATGGRYLGAAGSLPELTFRPSQDEQLNWRRTEVLWSRPWFWALVALLWCVYWWYRRRCGYL